MKITKNLNRKTMIKTSVDYLYIVIGCFFMASSYNVFQIPNNIVSGGVFGLSLFINSFSGFPIGLMMLIINVPIFIWGFLQRGINFSTKTIVATIILSLITDYIKLNIIVDDILLGALYGGAAMGIGLSFVFKAGATTGGTDLLASLIYHSIKRRYSVSNVLFVIDGLIILASALVFNLNIALFSMITAMVNTKVLDTLLTGFTASKKFTIITDKREKLIDRIINELGRGATIMKAQGAYTGVSHDVIVCIVKEKQVVHIRKIIQQEDDNAFVFVENVKEVLGEGFTWEKGEKKTKQM